MCIVIGLTVAVAIAVHFGYPNRRGLQEHLAAAVARFEKMLK